MITVCRSSGNGASIFMNDDELFTRVMDNTIEILVKKYGKTSIFTVQRQRFYQTSGNAYGTWDEGNRGGHPCTPPDSFWG